MTQEPETDTYREQLARWARSLAAAQNHAVDDVLAAGSSAFHVKMFTDGNLDKRFNKLTNALEFAAPAFEDFEDLVAAYVRELPLAAYDTGSSDAERMLRWLEQKTKLTLRQRDFVQCQRARHAVEAAARNNRAGHVRFQELASLAVELAATLDANPALMIQLNPIRAWTRFFTTALLDDDATPPVKVLFYAAGTDVATALLEPLGQALVTELDKYGPCGLDEWAMLSDQADRDGLVEFCRDSAEIGLVAFS